MARRILTVALALVLGTGAVLPMLGAWRCPTMGRRPIDSCCHPLATAQSGDDASPGRDDHRDHLAPRCCDPVDAPALEARAGASSIDDGSAAAKTPLHAVLPPPSHLFRSLDVSLIAAAQPRGRPPGERLHLFSPILRV